MSEAKITFNLLGYWHLGSGAGAGAVADAVVARDDAGLPYIPGRAVKGLMRHAMTLACVEPREIVRWFGTFNQVGPNDDDPEVELESSRFETRPGALRFGSARLSSDWIAWARGSESGVRDAVVDSLLRHVASTAISKSGVAEGETLRVREVAVPMTLIAPVSCADGSDGGDWLERLRSSAPLVRELGSRRNRGYGRVAVEVK